MRTMVATNQRDYATISHTVMTDSPDKSSCRSATINNNIWMPAGGTAGATLLHLTRSFASRRVASHRATHDRTCYFAVLSPFKCVPFHAIINRSASDIAMDACKNARGRLRQYEIYTRESILHMCCPLRWIDLCQLFLSFIIEIIKF